MALSRRQRVRISNYNFAATALLSVILPFAFLHHHRVAAILAIWSLLCLGYLMYLTVGHPRILRLSAGIYRRRLFTNAAITAVFFALWAIAAFYGRLDIAAGISELYLAGYVLYRLIKSRKQLELIDWLLATIFTASVIYLMYRGVTRGIVACGLPFAVAMLLWALLIGRRRVFMPELTGLSERIGDRISRLRSLEDDQNSTDTRPA